MIHVLFMLCMILPMTVQGMFHIHTRSHRTQLIEGTSSADHAVIICAAHTGNTVRYVMVQTASPDATDIAEEIIHALDITSCDVHIVVYGAPQLNWERLTALLHTSRYTSTSHFPNIHGVVSLHIPPDGQAYYRHQEDTYNFGCTWSGEPSPDFAQQWATFVAGLTPEQQDAITHPARCDQ